MEAFANKKTGDTESEKDKLLEIGARSRGAKKPFMGKTVNFPGIESYKKSERVEDAPFIPFKLTSSNSDNGVSHEDSNSKSQIGIRMPGQSKNIKTLNFGSSQRKEANIRHAQAKNRSKALKHPKH
jgi:hypothetical protein